MQDALRKIRRGGVVGLIALLLVASVTSLVLTTHQSVLAKQPDSTSNITVQKPYTPTRYEAEQAFLSGGVKSAKSVSGYSGSGYVSGFARNGAQTVFSVTVPTANTYPVILQYSSNTDSTLHLSANGLASTQVKLAATGKSDGWKTITTKVALRAGLNTLAFKHASGDSGDVNLDDVVVSTVSSGTTQAQVASATSSATTASRGATLSYTEVEAESAATNGTIIGPDYTFTDLPSEASGREAVQLSGQGKYVEFTLPQDSNAMTLRYSIPDSSDGSGQTAPLSLYVAGTYTQALTLTSKYSWFYGSYPFTNSPGDGKGHHFYDEIRVTFGSTLAAGTKVRLQVDAADTASWYAIDLADFYNVASQYSEPSGYLSIVDYGADPTGVNDSTQAVQNTVNAAESQGKGVWIPQGTFLVTSHIIVNNVTVRGAGPWYSVLEGNGVGVYGNYNPNPSQNVQLYDFAIFGQVMNRDDNAQVNGIGGALGGGSIVQDIWIEHTKCGMWFDGPSSNLLITGDTIRDTTADGINLHDGITNTTVTQTELRNTGDDGLAMWSETNADQNDTFSFDTVQSPILANDMAIYGGSDNSITDSIVYDSVTQGGGIHVGNRFNAIALAGTTTIARNTLIRCGDMDPNWQFGVGALWFYALDSAMSGTINVSYDEIDDSPYEAIHFIGSTISNLNFDHVTIDTAGTFALQEQAAGSAYFTYVTATNLGDAGQYNCGVGFTITQGAGNSGWDTSTCGFPSPGTTPTPVPTSAPTATPTPTPTPIPAPTGTLVAAINAGGAASGNFAADEYYDQGNEYSDTSTSVDTSGVASPAPQAVYQTCRWNSSFTYTIPGLVSGQSYTVQLDWAELSFQSAGQRTFNVAINGSTVLTNFDVYANAGYKKALAKQFTATANSSGQIVIAFSKGTADNPFINGIEVWAPSGAPTATPTPAPTLVTAVNAGGSSSGNFATDEYYDQGNEYSDTSSSIDTSGVANPAPQAVYQTCRWNSSFTYTIPGLTAGKSYTVRLDWAELTFQRAGQRTFNVAINGKSVLTNFDVYATAGYKKALAEQFTATANSSGQIVIAFTQGTADNPFINGIEIYDA